MDYAHAQRVATGLLLRRSQTSYYRQSNGTLSTLRYLNAPLDAFGNPQRAEQVIGPPAIESPVVGVGIGGTEENQRLVLLCDVGTKDVDFRRLMAAMDLGGFEIERLRTGPVKATARPASGGESLGHFGGDTGTFGCLVQNSSQEQFLLSCNHVIANLNSGAKGSDVIWQPGKKDGGSSKSRIGVLHDYAFITMGGVSSNHIDAALCRPDNPADASAAVRKVGTLAGTAAGTLNMSVKKSGATTGLTKGYVRLKNLSVIIDYANGSQALFDGQLGIIGSSSGNFADQGDSGAVVVDDANAAVGLVMSAVSGVDLTIANPIHDVLSHFGVTVC
jgi:hypothetical protein